MIPKVVHQIWIGELIDGIQECLDSIKKAMSSFDIRLYGQSEVNELVPENVSLVAKTDLFRNRILYKEGGWYVDADCYAFKPFNCEKSYSFGEQEQTTGNAKVCDWCYGSESGNPDLVALENRILSRPYEVNHNSGSHWVSEVVKDRTLESPNVFGSRRFASIAPSFNLLKNPTIVHLFLGSWYNPQSIASSIALLKQKS